MKIILSTRNPSKAEQIKAIFAGTSIKVLTLDEAGIKGEAVEDGTTLEENALKKARFVFEHANHDTWVMSDDTGLFIQHLNGEPGIRAARWAGDKVTTQEIMEYTLRKLEGAKNRAAHYETVAALISPEGESYIFKGEKTGRFLDVPRTEPQPKMPYSSIFLPDGCDRTWAEMTAEQENETSHRGIAFRKVKEFLLEQLKD